MLCWSFPCRHLPCMPDVQGRLEAPTYKNGTKAIKIVLCFLANLPCERISELTNSLEPNKHSIKTATTEVADIFT